MSFAVKALEDRAEKNGEKEAAVRILRRNNVAYLDLNNAEREVVEIDAEGWRIIKCPFDVRFIRNPNAAPLPRPIPPGGNYNITDLKRFVNISSNEDFYLIIAWVMGCFMGYEVPILVMNGQQNSGKSTNTNVIRGLLDPMRGLDLLTKPSNDRDMVSDIATRFVLAYDNLSRIEEWLSNALCNLSTGGTFGGRRLYSDNESARFSAVRPVILNGIPEFAKLDDLKRRMFHIYIPPVTSGQRDKLSIYEEFAQAHPSLLAIILDGVVEAFKVRARGSTPLNEPLPLRDPVVWANSACEALGLPKNAIIQAVRDGHSSSLEESFDDSYVARGVHDFMKDKKQWRGHSSELLKALWIYQPKERGRETFWPSGPRAMTTTLMKIAPALRKMGIIIDKVRSNGARLIQITWAPEIGVELTSEDEITQKDLRR